MAENDEFPLPKPTEKEIRILQLLVERNKTSEISNK